MSEFTKKKKKKLSKAGLIIIIGLIILAIPCVIFGAILGVAWINNGTPRDGSRFENDLTSEFSESQVEDIEADLKTISNIEELEVILSEGQLKIYIDTVDSLSQAECETIVNTAYNKVVSKLPIKTYFTRTDAAKMYDLVINVYTSVEASEIGTSNPRVYIQLHKNSAEEEYAIELLSQPRDLEQARELEGLTDIDEEVSEEEESQVESD